MRFNNVKMIKMLNNLNDKSQIDEFLNNKFLDKNTFNLIPFDLGLGTVNSTENGFVSENFEINSFTSYAKILTGLDNLVAKWDGAYNVFIDEEANALLPKQEQYITKEYKVGRLIKAVSTTDNIGSNSIPSPIDSVFNQIEIKDNITVQIKDRLNIKDAFKVFIIPEKNKWQWLYIADGGITEIFDAKNQYVYTELILNSVNSLYATSGGAVEQFIQKSAPGEGYAWPKWDNESKKIVLDEIRAKDLPIQSVQREYSGGAIFNTLFATGRPTIQETKPDGTIENTFNPKILAPRLLLPLKMETPQISPINTKPSAETDYYVSKNTIPTFEKYYKNWKEQFQNNFDLSMRKEFNGVIQMEPEATLESTNPIYKGSHQFILWDTNFIVNFNKDKFSTLTNKLTEPEIIIDGIKTIPEILAHNVFITNHLITLPLTAETNTTWKLEDVPIIGGFLNTLTLGIPIGWTNKNVRVQMGKLLTLSPANLVKYGNQLPNTEIIKNSLISFDLVKENNSLAENSGISGMGSSIKVKLTDMFEKNGKTYNTVELGQKQDDGTVLLWDGNCKPIPTTTPGFVIDQLIDRTIAKTNVRTVFFSYDYEAFQGTYKTKSKFTGEIRDWTNAIKMSNWKVDTGFIKWPEIIQQPTPPDITPKLIEIPTNFQKPTIDLNGYNYGEQLIIKNTGYNEKVGLIFGDRPSSIDFFGKDWNIKLADYSTPILDYDFSKQAPTVLQLQNIYEFFYIKLDSGTRARIYKIPTKLIDTGITKIGGNYLIQKLKFLITKGPGQLNNYTKNGLYTSTLSIKITSFDKSNLKFEFFETERNFRQQFPEDSLKGIRGTGANFSNAKKPTTQPIANNRQELENGTLINLPYWKLIEGFSEDTITAPIYIVPKNYEKEFNFNDKIKEIETKQ